MESLWRMYNSAWDKADPRVEVFPLMGSPLPMISILLIYLLCVVCGPRIMRDREPFQIRGLLIAHNFFLVFFSLGFVVTEMYLVYACLLSKILELTDTIFFILRKKNHQISFLHVYHHITITIVTWSSMKWTPGGQTWATATVNCMVHFVMYTYYGLAAIGPHMQKYLWWKRYLTLLQLAQFVSLLVHCIVNYYADCEFPKLFSVLMGVYLVTLFLLFLNFYINAYQGANKTTMKKQSGKAE